MRGASALDRLLGMFPEAPLRALVVWEPVLATDLAPPTTSVLGLVQDRRAIQLWDPGRTLSAAIRRAIARDPTRFGLEHPLDPDSTVWDILAVFDAGVRWGDSPPVPTFYGGPVVRAVVSAHDAIRAGAATVPRVGAETPPRPPLADVVSVAARGEPGALELDVGVASPDTGCERYADWWEVVDAADGRLIYRRVLRHSHVDEQPFVRSGGPVDVDADRTVWVRAHMHPTGYGGKAMKGSVRAGFVHADPEPGFAADLATAPPLPTGCEF